MRKGIVIAIVMSLMIALSACSTAGDTNGGETTVSEKNADKNHLFGIKDKKLSDTPDNPCNSGRTAILETEDGYYFNYGCAKLVSGTFDDLDSMYLRYCDKASGESILLCAKPECNHIGDDGCTATYKNMNVFNTVFYDGVLYVYGIDYSDNKVSYGLYRISRDGTSVDRVVEILSADNTMRETIKALPLDEYSFIIHKGYAYMPYYLQIGELSRGFVGGGLARVNIETGEVVKLVESETKNSPVPWHLKGIGDYVYFDSYKSPFREGTRRIVCKTGEIEVINPEYETVVFPLMNESRLYDIGFSASDTAILHVFDAADGKYIENEMLNLDFTRGEYISENSLFLYEHYLIVVLENRVVLYELTGEKIGEISYENPLSKSDYRHDGNIRFHLNDGKLYMVLNTSGDRYNGTLNMVGGAAYSWPLYEIYQCELKEIAEGNGEWAKACEFGYVE